jgi:four helix bundle protein
MTDFDKNELQKRLFQFAVNIILLLRKLPKGNEYQIISYQLIKSSSSSGANYEEAQGAVSRADFANKIGISLKEMRESNYWIRVVIAISDANEEWLEMKQESTELTKILGSIYSKTSLKR